MALIQEGLATASLKKTGSSRAAKDATISSKNSTRAAYSNNQELGRRKLIERRRGGVTLHGPANEESEEGVTMTGWTNP